MNEKTKAALTISITKNDRRYIFLMDVGSPIGEAYDAAHEILQEIIEISKKAAEEAKRAKEENKKENDKNS